MIFSLLTLRASLKRNEKEPSNEVKQIKQIQTPLISSTYQILLQSKCSFDKSKQNYKDSMISLKRTEYTITLNLIDYITNLISLETNTETLKESLALQNDISFPDLFYFHYAVFLSASAWSSP